MSIPSGATPSSLVGMGNYPDNHDYLLAIIDIVYFSLTSDNQLSCNDRDG